MKKCTECLIKKEISEFHKDSRLKCGVRSKCKECKTKIYNKKHNINPNAAYVIPATKECNKCHKIKTRDMFVKRDATKSGLYAYCKSCHNKLHIINNRTVSGFITSLFSNHTKRAKKHNYETYFTSFDKLKKWILNQDNFYSLFTEWKDSGFMKDFIPSIDRLDDYKGYSLDNIRLVTWIENKHKADYDRKNGLNNKISDAVIQYDMNMNFIAEYHSIRQAERMTNAFSSNISLCCNNGASHSGGFVWRYRDR